MALSLHLFEARVEFVDKIEPGGRGRVNESGDDRGGRTSAVGASVAIISYDDLGTVRVRRLSPGALLAHRRLSF